MGCEGEQTTSRSGIVFEGGGGKEAGAAERS